MLSFFLRALLIAGLSCLSVLSQAQDPASPALLGVWRINVQLSDDTDDQVEAALKKSGQKTKRGWFEKNKEYYRGGPPEQEMYDRVSYDKDLTIRSGDNAYQFEYNDGFIRQVFTDNRSRAVSLTDASTDTDFSLGHWSAGKFEVEGHPRDGGSTAETYQLLEGGKRLQVDFLINPSSFSETVELRRVYDRVQ